MKTTERLWKLMALLAMTLCIAGCSDGDDSEEWEYSDFIAVPATSGDTWVKADNITDDDITLLLDLGVKVEYMRLQFIKMLSNNFEGEGLFCGYGDKSDPDPIMRTYTDMMVKADEYEAATARLDAAGIMTLTTRSTDVGNVKKILTAGREENEKELAKIQDNLNKLAKKGKYDQLAQEQLYNYYKEQEPGYAKKIGATDARDFFKKLNNGELTSYATSIGHIWRDVGSLDADKANSRVGDYAVEAFTGHAEYAASAYRVASKVAEAAGEIYLSGIDKFAGGYGSKIIEMGDALETHIESMRQGLKLVGGKPDWQGINKLIVNSLMGKVKDALKETVGDLKKSLNAKDYTEEFVNQVAEEICDHYTNMLVSESAKEQDATTEKGKKQINTMGEDVDMAVLDIYADAGTMTRMPKMIIIKDDATGRITLARPDEQGRVMVPTFTGSKTITYLDGNGNRLTKTIIAEEGYNTVDIKSKAEPYLSLNPPTLSLEAGEDYSVTYVLTNCKYVKYRLTKKADWLSVKKDADGGNKDYIHLIAMAKANDTGRERTASVVVEGYDDNASNAKPVAKATLTVTQDVPLTGSVAASPTSLTFDAKGGSQKVQLTIEDLEYYGGYVDSKSEDWLSVAPGDNDQLIVSAKANETGKERSGTVYAYACNIPNPTLKNVKGTPIKVTQKAAEGDTGDTFIPSRVTINIAIMAKSKDGKVARRLYDDKGTGSYQIHYDFTEEEISYERNGDIIKVNLLETRPVFGYSDEKHISKASFSFRYAKDKTSEINDFEMDWDYSSEGYGIGERFSLKLDNIPFRRYFVSSTYSNSLDWEATEKDHTLNISYLDYVYEWNHGIYNNGRINYSLVNNENNKIYIDLSFK